MLIVCPSCASQYELDAAKLGPGGRKVRCAQCKTLWHVDAASEMPPAPSVEETQALLAEELERAAAIEAEIAAVVAEDATAGEAGVLEEEPPPVAPPETRPSAGYRARFGKAAVVGRKGLALPAVAALAGVTLLVGLAWQRNLVVQAAPQLAGLFERIGLPVNVRGLSLTAVESGLIDDGQSRFLVVEGDVTNIAKGRTKVPPIQVSVKDEAGQTLYSWTTEPPRGVLEPAELMRFRARLASPPEKGRSVQVRFTSTAGTANIASAH
ncbi:zinc-ribbon domain-containing protein [Bosea sp. UNC402CLCol]|uniref:zinc-ribbon domain-containing protein n=1 Tax=Bosea sp. UNC402CLCol TaxID=1510531 RepID=UPI00068DDD9B|nr:zinc-ribbon domain-containing protein [Bosea sp. UNC402CLCol]